MEVMQRAKQEGRLVLTEVESKEVLSAAGIRVNETRLAHSKEEALSLSWALGFPVVLKVGSPQIVHKSEAGGVRLNLGSEAEIAQAYEEILSSAQALMPQAVIHGISVQRMARPGIELIAGVSQDPQFGPVLMFGLGGIWSEILKDVAFRLIPITPRDAYSMVRQIRGYPLLEGYRTLEPVNLTLVEEMLLFLSRFAIENPWVREVDLNPIFAYREDVFAADARILLE